VTKATGRRSLLPGQNFNPRPPKFEPNKEIEQNYMNNKEENAKDRFMFHSTARL
jgi:hypothetical protein